MSPVSAPASTTQSWTDFGHGVTINESAWTEQARRVLPNDLIRVIADLHRELQPMREDLLAAREERQAAWDAGDVPGYLPEDEHPAAHGDWEVPPRRSPAAPCRDHRPRQRSEDGDQHAEPERPGRPCRRAPPRTRPPPRSRDRFHWRTRREAVNRLRSKPFRRSERRTRPTRGDWGTTEWHAAPSCPASSSDSTDSPENQHAHADRQRQTASTAFSASGALDRPVPPRTSVVANRARRRRRPPPRPMPQRIEVRAPRPPSIPTRERLYDPDVSFCEEENGSTRPTGPVIESGDGLPVYSRNRSVLTPPGARKHGGVFYSSSTPQNDR